eukprot:COSAG06_NODE_66401_length_254_cov_0.987097_1_plen_27_part_10
MAHIKGVFAPRGLVVCHPGGALERRCE